MSKIRVLVVEDSMVVRELLHYIIDSDPRLEVVAAVGSAEAALEILERVAPDVISLDIRLPGMNGLDATLQIMSRHPTPIVVVAASVADDDLNIAMNALRAGALAVMEKPVGVTSEAYQSVANRLCTQLAIMSEVKVLRQGNRRLNFGSGPVTPPPRSRMRELPHQPAEMLGVVASTGGPNALVQLFNALGTGYPLPILLVQHITSSFLEGFVTWLSGITPFEVRIAIPGERPQPGYIYVAPADHHLALCGGLLRIPTDAPECNQRPSGSVLFRSMAQDLGNRAIGVLLTGMGSDGADGMLEMHRAGAHTIAEDETTAVVYGMPAAAVKLSAVRDSLPLTAIAPKLLQLTGGPPQGRN
jgi:two-component system chemotaxis response regulator CheB